MRKLSLAALAVVALVAATPPGRDAGINSEGFVQKWLVLAPIALGDGVNGGEAVDKEQIKDEAKLKPQAGEAVKVGGKDLKWKEAAAEEHLVDFNKILGSQVEDSAAYAATYITSPEEMTGVKMKTGSDDQLKVYLNGKEVLKVAEARPTDKDQETTEVTLRKGVNVLVVKVINEKVDWSFCVRFTDKSDKPLTSLSAKTSE